MFETNTLALSQATTCKWIVESVHMRIICLQITDFAIGNIIKSNTSVHLVL